jgi:phosphoenolpyruvate mutase
MQDANGAARSTDQPDPRPIVYVAMVGDILHAGHINILNCASRLGRVIVGVLTDGAAASYKRLPFMSFDQRRLIFENMRDVHRVVAQETLSYRTNLLALKPRYVLHGDDWREGIQAQVRTEVLELLRDWEGELVEVPYTPGVSSTMLHESLRESGIAARGRQQKLRALLNAKALVRIIEVHSPVAGIVAERARESGREFDGFWSSSLTDSLMHGRPDIEVLDYRTRVASIVETFEVTSKPLIYDGDSGGNPESAYYLAKALVSCGVSGLCLEDKIGRKHNSLYGHESSQKQATIAEFTSRISSVRSAVPEGGMMLIARIESLVLGRPIEEALERADAYCAAGADGILIHSVHRIPDEVFAFTETFRAKCERLPVFAVPTTYARTSEREMIDHGIRCVIYSNQLLRASYSAMARAAADILKHERCEELSDYSADPFELLALIPEPKCFPQ